MISANMLKEEMQKMGHSDEFVKQCYLAIYKHSWHDMPETLEGMVVRDADKIDFVGLGRWKQCIEEKHDCNSILKLLPKLRSELLQLECSKTIYDIEVAKLVEYLHNRIFNIWK